MAPCFGCLRALDQIAELEPVPQKQPILAGQIRMKMQHLKLKALCARNEREYHAPHFRSLEILQTAAEFRENIL